MGYQLRGMAYWLNGDYGPAAVDLARALELPLPLKEQLQAFDRHRAPRTARVVRESTEMGQLYHITDAAENRSLRVSSTSPRACSGDM